MSKIAWAVGLLACLLMATQSEAINYDAAMGAQTAIQSILSSVNANAASIAGRSLLQSKDGEFDGIEVPECLWDEDDGVCSVYPLVAVDLLAQAPPSPLKEMIVDVVVCGLSQTEELCKDGDAKCKWNGASCEPEVDISDKDTLASCLSEEASVFLNGAAKYVNCADNFNTKDSCNIQDDCGWLETGDGGSCVFDLWKYLTGVPSQGKLPLGTKELMTKRAAQIAKAVVLAEFKNHDEVLDFQPPPFECPAGVDLVVCNVAARADELLLTQVYCKFRLKDGICADDALCEPRGEKCVPSDAVRVDVVLAQREVYLQAIKDPTAASLLRKELLCLDNSEPRCRDDCIWESESKRCTLNPNLVMKELSGGSVEHQSVTCQVVQGLFKTGCLVHTTEALCNSGEACIWDDEDGLCAPGPQAYMSILFSDDRDLERQMLESMVSCAQKTTEDRCSK